MHSTQVTVLTACCTRSNLQQPAIATGSLVACWTRPPPLIHVLLNSSNPCAGASRHIHGPKANPQHATVMDNWHVTWHRSSRTVHCRRTTAAECSADCAAAAAAAPALGPNLSTKATRSSALLVVVVLLLLQGSTHCKTSRSGCCCGCGQDHHSTTAAAAGRPLRLAGLLLEYPKQRASQMHLTKQQQAAAA